MGGRRHGPTREAFAERSGPALDADGRRSRYDRPYRQSGLIDTRIYDRIPWPPRTSAWSVRIIYSAAELP